MVTHSSILAWRIPMDRVSWQAAVHGVAKSWAQLSEPRSGGGATRGVTPRPRSGAVGGRSYPMPLSPRPGAAGGRGYPMSPPPRSRAVAGKSNPISKEPWLCRRRRA